jgi:hypothetical protein
MIPLLVFYIHVIAFAVAYTRRWQEEGVSEGMLTLFFMALIFFVGWSMASFIVKIVMPAGGADTILDRDSASLLFLTAAESVFYYFFLKSDSPKGDVSPE